MVNVTRHPYSFSGDARGVRGGYGAYAMGEESPWSKGLLATCGGDAATCEVAKAEMLRLAQQAGIPTLRYDVKCCWQPINSQRMLLWARRFGKAERFMDALGRKHFTEAKSASHDWTILDAAEEAGLDPAEAEAFLNSDELSEDVWQSYGTTVREKGIHAIPYFVFNSPQSNAGKFRRGHGQALVVNGSASETEFLSIFEGILADLDRVAAAL
mmetsp:Transcript_3683/g.7416  ORF Transcript_3683/g.7416 Transcript_3683/m.7416 type:complete len:213 (+) Transcript_3683:334-972(+)